MAISKRSSPAPRRSSSPPAGKKLIENAELARISKQLVTLEQAVPVEIDLDGLVRQPISPSTLFPFLKAMEFATITRRLAGLLEANPDDFEPDRSSPRAAPRPRPAPAEVDFALGGQGQARRAHRARHRPGPLCRRGTRRVKALPIDYAAYETVTTPERLAAWVAAIRDVGRVAVDTETTGLDPQQADLVGICLATAIGTACYIPLGHRKAGDLLEGGGLVDGQLPIRDVLDA